MIMSLLLEWCWGGGGVCVCGVGRLYFDKKHPLLILRTVVERKEDKVALINYKTQMKGRKIKNPTNNAQTHHI